MRWLISSASVVALALIVGCSNSDTATAEKEKAKTPGNSTVEPGAPNTPDSKGTPDSKTTPDTSSQPGRAGLSQYLTEQTVAVAVLNPQKLLQAKTLEGLPVDDAVDSANELPFDPRDLTRVRVYLALGELPDGPPNGVAELTFSKDMGVKDIFPDFPDVEPQMVNGHPLYEPEPGGPIVYQPDARTIIVANGSAERAIIEGKATGKGPLAAELGGLQTDHAFSAVVTLDPVRDMLKQLADQAGAQVPEQYQSYLELAETLKTARLAFDLEAKPLLSASLRGVDDAATARIKTQANSGTALLKQLYAGARGMFADQIPEEMQELVKMADDTVNGIEVADVAGEVTIQLNAPEGMGKLAQLLAPAIEQAKVQAERTKRMNEVRNVVLAFHNYEATHRHFPLAAVKGDNGEPLFSWRVELLPFLEQDAVFNQFDRTKAWDSSENKALSSTPIPIYGPGTKSRLVVLTGPGTFFDGDKPKSFLDAKDGASNTILVVQLPDDGKAVDWAAPVDIKFDPANPLAGIAPIPPQGLTVGFVDGSVRVLPSTITPEQFKGLVTIAGGEQVDLE